MTDTDCPAIDPECETVDEPAGVRRLECDLATAFHAFAEHEGMSVEHRDRMIADATGAVLDAASAAGRSGHGRAAVRAVWRAGGRRPAWAGVTPGWADLLAACLDAIAAAECSDTEAAAECSDATAAADHSEVPPPTIGA